MMWDSLSSKRLVNWNYFIVHFTTMNKGRNKVSCCKKCRNKAGNLNFVLSDTKRTPIGCLLFNLEMFKYLVTSEFQNKRKVIKLWCITNVSFKKKNWSCCAGIYFWNELFCFLKRSYFSPRMKTGMKAPDGMGIVVATADIQN